MSDPSNQEIAERLRAVAETTPCESLMLEAAERLEEVDSLTQAARERGEWFLRREGAVVGFEGPTPQTAHIELVPGMVYSIRPNGILHNPHGSRLGTLLHVENGVALTDSDRQRLREIADRIARPGGNKSPVDAAFLYDLASRGESNG